MYTTIQKWGNSNAIRIPKTILEMTELSENDKVELRVQDGNITIIPIKRHISLAERIAEYEEEYICEELDVGTPKGKEVL